MEPSVDRIGVEKRSAKRKVILAGAAGLGLALAMAILSLFSVDATEYALVTEFGAPVHVITTPGLYAKLPYQTVKTLDHRLAAFTPSPSEFLTLEKTPVVASTGLVWRVGDPKRFLETVFDRAGAESRLSDIVYAELGAAIGHYPLQAIVSADPVQYQAADILAGVRARCAEIVGRDYGIELVDLVLQSFDFPKQNRDRLYARMKSERARLSMAHRSEGEEQAMKIGTMAEEERSRLLADALERAQAARAEGDGEAARISAQAFQAAPDFYRFLRTLDASKRVVRKDTTLLLRADSDLFGLLLDSHRFEHEIGTGEASIRTP
jgi:modulator of FtsH protease HflC